MKKGLSCSELDNSIRADMYHSLGSGVMNFKEKLSLPQRERAAEFLKELRSGRLNCKDMNRTGLKTQLPVLTRANIQRR